MVHLIVVCHGQWGFPSHVGYIASCLKCSLPQSDHLVYRSRVNRFFRTYHGIVACGNRLFDEVLSVINKHNDVDKISFVGYSAGGLFSRYCIGRLFAEGWLGEGKRLTGLVYVSMATPHLGTFEQPNFVKKLTHCALPRAGRQFTLSDEAYAGRPLLDILSDPQLPFLRGLKTFARIACYANVQFDRTVPYRTASVSLGHPSASPLSHGRSKTFPHIGKSYDNDDPLDDADDQTDMDDVSEAPRPSKISSILFAIIPPLLVLILIVPWLLIMTIMALTSWCCVPKESEIPECLLVPVKQEDESADGQAVDLQLSDDADLCTNDVKCSDDQKQAHERIFHNLRRYIVWRRVDVHLPGPHTHGRIVVRRLWSDSCGKDVVAHMVARQFLDILKCR